MRIFVLIFLCLLSLSARAAEVDMGAPIIDEQGSPAPDPFDQAKDDTNCMKCPRLTLGLAAAHALLYQDPAERDLDPLQKWARGDLALKVRQGKSVTLSAEETAVIKRLIGKIFGPIVIRQAYPMLDPGSVAPAVK